MCDVFPREGEDIKIKYSLIWNNVGWRTVYLIFYWFFFFLVAEKVLIKVYLYLKNK